MRKIIQTLACGAICLSALTTASVIADTVAVPVGQQGYEKQAIPRPAQGMSKEQVQQQYGEPKDWRDPVGDPPISSWTYEHFTVYFEYGTVIHSVLTHQAVN